MDKSALIAAVTIPHTSHELAAEDVLLIAAALEVGLFGALRSWTTSRGALGRLTWKSCMSSEGICDDDDHAAVGE